MSVQATANVEDDVPTASVTVVASLSPPAAVEDVVLTAPSVVVAVVPFSVAAASETSVM